MPVSDEIQMFRLEQELHVCPACGYEYGFHTSFLDVNATTGGIKVKVTNRVFKIVLICPECGARFDVGWRMTPVEMPVHVHGAEGTVKPPLPVRALGPASPPE
jgi:predicted RNA-binding Zn-ribbon protein involved in translation (DUF1610 family)